MRWDIAIALLVGLCIGVVLWALIPWSPRDLF